MWRILADFSLLFLWVFLECVFSWVKNQLPALACERNHVKPPRALDKHFSSPSNPPQPTKHLFFISCWNLRLSLSWRDLWRNSNFLHRVIIRKLFFHSPQKKVNYVKFNIFIDAAALPSCFDSKQNLFKQFFSSSASFCCFTSDWDVFFFRQWKRRERVHVWGGMMKAVFQRKCLQGTMNEITSHLLDSDVVMGSKRKRADSSS